MTTTTTTKTKTTEVDNNKKRKLFERTMLNLPLALLPIDWLKQWMSRKFSHPVPNYDKMAFLVMDGLTYGECPRIHDNHLYASMMHDKCVCKFELETHTVVKRMYFDDKVSGLGWLPNGKMLVVSMTKRKLLCYDETTDDCEDYADISAVTQYRANDMVVDTEGNAYVGNFGFDFRKLSTVCTTTTVRVDTDRNVHVESTGLLFPNGIVISPDGKTVMVNETMAGKITAFDRDIETGALSKKRLWADIGAPVDGCCLDAEGYIWTCVPQVGAYKTSGVVARVAPDGGGIVETLGFGRNGLQGCPIACVLATAPDGRHVLYVMEAETADDDLIETNYGTTNARLKAVYVDVGPARRPDNPRYNSGFC